jgi:hypothetical protein
MSAMITNLRTLLGVLVKDWRRYHRALRAPGTEWLRLCNRYERVEVGPDGVGVRADWEWTSVLHAPTVLPSLGRRLLGRALAAYPFLLAEQPTEAADDRPPEVSFVIGHRGLERLPHLLATLRSIAGQRNVRFECILVEQSVAPEVQDHLPAWVRYLHTPLPAPEMPYCRAWAFNVGARMASGELLILHDNDLLIPQDYTCDHLRLLHQGWEVINLKRYIFYLSRQATHRLFETEAGPSLREAPESILQNAEGGGSLAIARDAYFAIGGFDEAFIGWGGEDNELWDRALTRRLYPFGHLPLVHLWHSAQPGKRTSKGPGFDTALLARQCLALPPRARIQQLIQRDQGNPLYLGGRYEID